MKKYKYWNIEIDGPDKTGKSTICKYITQLSNYRFATHDRGYMTQVVYSKKFNRDYVYSLPDKNTIFILLTSNEKEHSIRCTITNENKIDFKSDMQMFTDVYQKLVSLNYKCLYYNTSKLTAYEISKSIIHEIDRWEAQEYK